MANFIQTCCVKAFNNLFVYNRVGLWCISETFFGQKAQILHDFLPEWLNLEGQWEFTISEGALPIDVPKCYRGKTLSFWYKTFKLFGIILSGTRSLPFNYQHCGSHEHAPLRDIHSHRNCYCSQSVSEKAKLRFTSRMMDRILPSSLRTWVTFLLAMLARTS